MDQPWTSNGFSHSLQLFTIPAYIPRSDFTTVLNFPMVYPILLQCLRWFIQWNQWNQIFEKVVKVTRVDARVAMKTYVVLQGSRILTFTDENFDIMI